MSKERYERELRINIRSSQIMEDKVVFWGTIQDLSEMIRKNIGKRDDAVRYSIKEFLRQGYEHDFASFIRTYGKLKNSLMKNLKSLGDPSEISDLVDSLPLSGKKVCLKILAGEIEDYESLTSLIGENNAPELVNLIITQENFTEQRLEEVYSNFVCGSLISGDFAQEIENANT